MTIFYSRSCSICIDFWLLFVSSLAPPGCISNRFHFGVPIEENVELRSALLLHTCIPSGRRAPMRGKSSSPWRKIPPEFCLLRVVFVRKEETLEEVSGLSVVEEGREGAFEVGICLWIRNIEASAFDAHVLRYWLHIEARLWERTIESSKLFPKWNLSVLTVDSF